METIVIDANIALALLVQHPLSPLVEQRMIAWKQQRAHLCAPSLWISEVVSGLRKIVSAGRMDQESALQAIANVERWGVTLYLPDTGLSRNALLWAERLNQPVAYDAPYLALAERLQAKFYTADKKLFARCREIGVAFVSFVE